VRYLHDGVLYTMRLNTFTSHSDEIRKVVSCCNYPKKTDLTYFGQSVNSASSRFLSVEKKSQLDADLRIEYTKFMKDYLEMGHMQEVM